MFNRNFGRRGSEFPPGGGGEDEFAITREIGIRGRWSKHGCRRRLERRGGGGRCGLNSRYGGVRLRREIPATEMTGEFMEDANECGRGNGGEAGEAGESSGWTRG